MKKSQQGFSLLEVLIALGIFATAAVIFLSGTGQQLLLNRQSENEMTALFLVRNKMAELEIELAEEMARNKFPDKVEKKGRFDEPYEDYYWEYSIKKVQIPYVSGQSGEQKGTVQRLVSSQIDELSKKIRQVQLTVYWGEEVDEEKRDDSQELTITTHIADMN